MKKPTASEIAAVLMAIVVGVGMLTCSKARANEHHATSKIIVCTNDATGKTTLVADGRKVRVAYWDKTNNRPYFTDSNRASRHKRVFAAPKGSTCRVQP